MPYHWAKPAHCGDKQEHAELTARISPRDPFPSQYFRIAALLAHFNSSSDLCSCNGNITLYQETSHHDSHNHHCYYHDRHNHHCHNHVSHNTIPIITFLYSSTQALTELGLSQQLLTPRVVYPTTEEYSFAALTVDSVKVNAG